MSETIIQCENVVKIYRDGHLSVPVLKTINLSIGLGEQIAIVGPSGSGKSTLLHLLGGLDKTCSGDVKLLGKSLSTLSEKKRCQMRNKSLGFVYQFHHLLPEFNACENVMMPLLIGGMLPIKAKNRAEECLVSVGLSERLTHKPSQLSGGERQRVAIARALVNKPQCILADEPTGNLDSATADKVFESFLKLNQENDTALVIVTHDLQLAFKMQRVFHLEKGQLIEK